MIMRKQLVTLVFLLALVFTAHAQIHTGINATTGFPLNEFKAQNPGTAFGININMFFPHSESSPVFWGVDLNFQGMGAREVSKVVNTDVNGTSVPIDFKLANRNRLFSGHFVIRAKVPTQGVQPYVEGLVGLKYFYTRTFIKEINTGNSAVSEQEMTRNSSVGGESLQRSIAFSHGLGIGAQMMFSQFFGANIGLRYLWGSPAKYYTKQDIRDFDVAITANNGVGNDEYGAVINGGGIGPRRSRTDMLVLNVGLIINFQ
ncbi:hypothetical protein [uncultured Microscilla sp.]|uniref:hypothetical protein n=1 Tax=uncultured Microscilla sp. TaxID=432653 RepID=UPI00262BA898|nr:hypothetical protein [uncultured Microscilla sp.]